MPRSTTDGTKSSPTPSTIQLPAAPDLPSRTRGASTEPTGSASTISTAGFLERRKEPVPASVPPLPTPATKASTRPAICAQISGPVPSEWARGFAGLLNWGRGGFEGWVGGCEGWEGYVTGKGAAERQSTTKRQAACRSLGSNTSSQTGQLHTITSQRPNPTHQPLNWSMFSTTPRPHHPHPHLVDVQHRLPRRCPTPHPTPNPIINHDITPTWSMYSTGSPDASSASSASRAARSW
jgi:hypothetical protein